MQKDAYYRHLCVPQTRKALDFENNQTLTNYPSFGLFVAQRQ
jgi:hypothetical protein